MSRRKDRCRGAHRRYSSVDLTAGSGSLSAFVSGDFSERDQSLRAPWRSACPALDVPFCKPRRRRWRTLCVRVMGATYRHFGAMSHVDMSARSGTPVAGRAAPEPSICRVRERQRFASRRATRCVTEPAFRGLLSSGWLGIYGLVRFRRRSRPSGRTPVGFRLGRGGGDASEHLETCVSSRHSATSVTGAHATSAGTSEQRAAHSKGGEWAGRPYRIAVAKAPVSSASGSPDGVGTDVYGRSTAARM
jgi:hypothetical protein